MSSAKAGLKRKLNHLPEVDFDSILGLGRFGLGSEGAKARGLDFEPSQAQQQR